MAAPQNGPLTPWVTDEQVRECCPGLDPDFDLEVSILYASAILFKLSGRKYPGQITRTVHPCFGTNSGCGRVGFDSGGDWNWTDPTLYGFGSGMYSGFPTIPQRVDGEWYNFGACAGECSLPGIRVPGPIVSVEEIVIDGEVLDPAAYRVEGYRTIRRIDGHGWPCTNDLAEPSDAVNGVEGTWEITYTFGRPVPDDAILPAAVFACQIAKARCGSGDCQLPQRVTELVRNGVRMFFGDSLKFIEKHQVGIYEVDLWLHSENPNGLAQRSTVRRADDHDKTTVWTT